MRRAQVRKTRRSIKHHHDHEAHAPGEHHVDARILEPIDQLAGPTPLPTPNASATSAIFHDSDSEIRSEENM